MIYCETNNLNRVPYKAVSAINNQGAFVRVNSDALG